MRRHETHGIPRFEYDFPPVSTFVFLPTNAVTYGVPGIPTAPGRDGLATCQDMEIPCPSDTVDRAERIAKLLIAPPSRIPPPCSRHSERARLRSVLWSCHTSKRFSDASASLWGRLRTIVIGLSFDCHSSHPLCGRLSDKLQFTVAMLSKRLLRVEDYILQFLCLLFIPPLLDNLTMTR